jgi:DNA recombination protein RmuC
MDVLILTFLIIVLILLIILIIFIYFLKKEGATSEELTLKIKENIGDTEKRISDQFHRVTQSISEIKGTADYFGQISTELKDLLSGERKRGKLGEILIENILNDVLPSSCWEKQYRLGSCGIVDIVIKTKENIIPIDCKFPLNNYQLMMEEEDPQKRESYLKKFIRDVKARIDETSKYVAPEIDTTDYSLMYVPAISVFLTIIDEEDLIHYSIDKQVLLCSPLSLYYILHAINETIKREQLPEKIEMLYREFLKLRDEINTFVGDFNTLGGHIEHAHNKYYETEKKIRKIQADSGALVLEDDTFRD